MSLIENRSDRTEPSFTLQNRMLRVLWSSVYFLFVRYSPVQFRIWRIFVYRLFGGTISSSANIYPKARVWAPWNLTLESDTCLANDVYIYNQATVKVKNNALVSQGANICTGTHDYETVNFKLIAQPIVIGAHAWVASQAFVGPGVNVGEGAVLGARTVVFQDVDEWGVYIGNPAIKVKTRKKEALWS